MRFVLKVKITALLSLMSMSVAAFSQSMNTVTECIPAHMEHQFKCSVMISDGTIPILDDSIIVNAMMPSMPMSHNVKPVKLNMVDVMNGRYEFVIQLEMLGEWVFSYDLQKPKRERLTEKIMFGKGSHKNHSHGSNHSDN